MLINNYGLSLLFITLLSAVLAAYAYRRRTTPGAGALCGAMLSLAIYSYGYAMELCSPALNNKLFWNDFQYLGIPFMTSLYLLFVLQFTGQTNWIKPRAIWLLFVIPVATTLASYTNHWHRLFYIRQYLDPGGPFPMLCQIHGPLFFLYIVYSYLVLLIAIYLLIRSRQYMASFYQQQVLILLAGAATPAIASMFFIAKATTPPQIDYTPFAFAVTGICLTYGLFRYQLLTLRPIARSAVLDAMRDGVLIADHRGMVVDINATAARLLEVGAQQVIGKPAAPLLARWPELAGGNGAVPEGSTEILLPGPAPAWLDVQCSSLAGFQGQNIGYMYMMRDISNRKRAEAAEQERRLKERELESLRTAAGTLAHEVNNPLTGIILNLEMLADGSAETTDCAMMIAEALAASKRIKEVVAKMQNLHTAEYKPYLSNRVIVDLDEEDS